MESYIRNAEKHGFDLDRLEVVFVTEDFCDTDEMRRILDENGVSGGVFDEEGRQGWMEENGVSDFDHLIPEASHAQTSFGLLYTWKNGFDYGFFIDDDTRPVENDYFGDHLENIGFSGKINEVESSTNWVNVLHQNHEDHGLYPRGYPYGAMDEELEVNEIEIEEGDVVASQGLWTNVPDLDAVRILMEGDVEGLSNTRLGETDYGKDFVAARNNYLTVCSMNLCFRREVIPAFYQLPMDDNPWGVGRFDDIWSGVFLKRAADVLGKDVVTGDPLCRHDKAPRSTFDDLHNEVAGLELNEHLWKLIDDAGADADTYAGVFRAMADALLEAEADYRNGDFLAFVGEHMHDWLDCLDELRPVERAVPADD